MVGAYSTHRLSPKKQVTLLRGFFGFWGRGSESGIRFGDDHEAPRKWGTIPHIVGDADGRIRRKMDAIDELDLPASRRQQLRTRLASGNTLPVDGQRRVVLPTPLVEHLAVEKGGLHALRHQRAACMESHHWQRWQEATSASAEDDAFLQGLITCRSTSVGLLRQFDLRP